MAFFVGGMDIIIEEVCEKRRQEKMDVLQDLKGEMSVGVEAGMTLVGGPQAGL